MGASRAALLNLKLKLHHHHVVLLLLAMAAVMGGYSEVTLRYNNECDFSVWAGSSPDIGELLNEYPAGTLTQFQTPDEWTGSLWFRTGCSYVGSNFTCLTGDCGRGEELTCSGAQPQYPVTMVNLGIKQSVVTYEVSLIHGYNIPIRVVPDGGTNCRPVECPHDVRNVCPSDLVFAPQGTNIGCMNPCDAFNDPQYCCTGNFSSPGACKPSTYSDMFKSTCPTARTFAQDNSPPVYQCTGASYNITLCPISR